MSNPRKPQKPRKPQRPFWITLNKVLVGLHWMADKNGLIVSEPVIMARAAQVHWTLIDDAIQCLERAGQLTFVDSSSLPWTIQLHHVEPGPPHPAIPPLSGEESLDRVVLEGPLDHTQPGTTLVQGPAHSDDLAGGPAKTTQQKFAW